MENEQLLANLIGAIPLLLSLAPFYYLLKSQILKGMVSKDELEKIVLALKHDLERELDEKGIANISFDPYVPNMSSVPSLSEFLEKSDFIIVITGHNQFLDIDVKEFKLNNVFGIVDGRNILDKEALKFNGIKYSGIGRK